MYGTKVWHSTSKYRRTVWQCNGKFQGEKKCTMPHLYEKDVKRIFLDFVNSLISERKDLLKVLKESLMAIINNGLAEVGKEIAARNAKRSELENFLKVLGGRDKLSPIKWTV